MSDEEYLPPSNSTTKKRKIKAEPKQKPEKGQKINSEAKQKTPRKRKIKAENADDTEKKRRKLEETSLIDLTSPGKNDCMILDTKPKQKQTRKQKIKVEKDDDETVEEKVPKRLKIKSEKNEIIDLTCPYWNDYELLAERRDIPEIIAKNVIKLFEDGNTIPFIARYRRDKTGNMSPEILRDVKETFEEICCLKSKMSTVVKSLHKLGQLNPNLQKSIKFARSIEELEIIYAPFKPGGKRTLAERAKELGLEEPAMTLMNNTNRVNLNHYVTPDRKELSTKEDVEKGIIHIIAYVIATDSEMLSFLRELRRQVNFILETKKSKAKIDTKPKTKFDGKSKQLDESKFENYFDYKIPVKYVKPHQILAINRGEHNKILSVKIVMPEFVFHRFSQFCHNKWVQKGEFYFDRKKVMDESIKDSYHRLVQPFIIREIRAELTANAEKASYDVFSMNLKHLLLAAPLRGKPILAIDPGYSNGCKLALVSKTGSLLSYNVIFPGQKFQNADIILKNMLEEHNCNLIALGNGTACRETEEWLTQLIQNKFFYPLDVTYTIVNEDGASVYSCSPEAKKEFPDLDTNIVSAVSLAKRIQDPLAELVKVEPQHLGVGMYQHDLKKKTLGEALNEVVSECVSFVGVDLNTASQCLLRRIAGLSDKRASQIIEYRAQNGPFSYRKELLNVYGIGARVFEQCAGFLRVGPIDAQEAVNFYNKPNTTKLDCTYIHPESYTVANKLFKKLNLKPEDIGEPHFINQIKSKNFNMADLSAELQCTNENAKLIVEALSKPLNYDFRSEVSQVPLFKKGLTSIYDITCGTTLTGRVRNVTHFGCFVDIGVGSDGLIHSSKLNGFNLQIGDKVEVKVVNLEINKKRIGLEALKKI